MKKKSLSFAFDVCETDCVTLFFLFQKFMMIGGILEQREKEEGFGVKTRVLF